MSMRKLISLPLIALALGTTACGSDDGRPGGQEREDQATVATFVRNACDGKVSQIISLDHEGHGRTSGFLALCADSSVEVVDDDGGRANDSEQQDKSSVEAGISSQCDGKVRSVTALQHEGHGRTSGFMLLCADGTPIAIDR